MMPVPLCRDAYHDAELEFNSLSHVDVDDNLPSVFSNESKILSIVLYIIIVAKIITLIYFLACFFVKFLMLF